MQRQITDRFVNALKTGNARGETADSLVPGLRLRVNQDGTKTWSLVATQPGPGKNRQKKFRVTLGEYPALTTAKAREQATALKLQIKNGYNPALARAEALASAEAAANAVTVREALDLYAKAKLSAMRSGAATERDLARDFAKLMNQKAHKVTPKQIAAIIDAKAQKSPVMARRLHAYGRAWFGWLASRQHVEANPFEKLDAPGTEKARERVLASREVGAIWNALPMIGAPFVHCFRVLLLTGQRREEVAGMRRDELDLEAKTWTVPAERSKTGRALRVPLPDSAVAEITAALKTARGKTLVFSTTGDTSLSGFSHAKARLDKAVQALLDKEAQEAGETPAPVPGWRLHDFRRTMVSTMADMGIDATVADRCLNHKASATMSTVQRVYQQSDLFTQRQHATNAWAAKVLEWAGGRPSGNVLPYQREVTR